MTWLRTVELYNIGGALFNVRGALVDMGVLGFDSSRALVEVGRLGVRGADLVNAGIVCAIDTS